MAFAQKAPATSGSPAERRRHQRVPVNLLGRYMLQDRREFPCQVRDMSPGGMAVIAPVIGEIGERVIAYIDHLGRLEGRIARHIDNGFAMTILATPRKRDKLAAQLTWLANREILGLPEDRRHDRAMPARTAARLTLADGQEIMCRLIDLSLSGAALATPARPDIGMAVSVGRVPGRVVRHLDDGIAVEFANLQHPDFVEDSVTEA